MYSNQQPGFEYTNPAAVHYSAARPAMPATNAGWAAAALVFFWPIAFSAFNYSSRVSALWLTGDYSGAEYASARAKSLGKTALLISVVMTTLVVIAYAVAVAAMISSIGNASHR